jgi:hypothetical protein
MYTCLDLIEGRVLARHNVPARGRLAGGRSRVRPPFAVLRRARTTRLRISPLDEQLAAHLSLQ